MNIIATWRERPPRGPNDGRRQGFEQETRAMAALNHPYICQIYDVGPGYLVLEYVEGKALQSGQTEDAIADAERAHLPQS